MCHVLMSHFSYDFMVVKRGEGYLKKFRGSWLKGELKKSGGVWTQDEAMGRSQMTSSKNLHFNFLTPSPASSSVITTQLPHSEQKMTSSWPDPPRTFNFFRFMVFKIDKHLSSILIAKGVKPAQKIAYED